MSVREDIVTGKVSLFTLINSKKHGGSASLLQAADSVASAQDDEDDDFAQMEDSKDAASDKLTKKVKSVVDESFRRNFALKRVDPLAGTAVKLSSNRMTAKLRSTMTSSKSLEALDNFTKHCVEHNSSNPVKRLLGKYIRTLEEEASELEKIPFSKPTNRSLKKNTRFPSVDSIIKEKAEKKEREIVSSGFQNPEEIASMMVASICASVGAPVSTKIKGNGRAGTSINFSVEESVFDDMRVKIEDNEFERANQARGRAIPALSEDMIEYENELERTSRLRTLCDR